MENKEKIAVVVQRYGAEINGGAELHARLLCQKLKNNYNITVLTTCSVDYQIWDNSLNEGESYLDGIRVKRFKSISNNSHKVNKKYRKLAGVRRHHLFLKKIKLFWLYKKLGLHYITKSDQKKWIRYQGPYCPGLIDFLKVNSINFKKVIFFTYLYYPTFEGIQITKNNILIPTAHDEPPFYFKSYRYVFHNAKFIMYNSWSEKRLVESVYPKTIKTPSAIAGVGFDDFDIESIEETKVNNNFPYIIYLGRIDKSKGCDILLDYFEKYIRETKSDLKLIMVGKSFMELNSNYENVIFTGFVSNSEKYHYLLNCKALIIPSIYESLSLVTLEAMQHGKPVIANESCEVIKDHIEISQSGFLYNNYTSFSKILQNLEQLSSKEFSKISLRGKKYIEENYRWDKIIDKFTKAIDAT